MLALTRKMPCVRNALILGLCIVALFGCVNLEVQKAQSASNSKKPAYSTSAKSAVCQGATEDRTNELCAQWLAADAAASSSRWAGLGVGVAFLTLIAAAAAGLYARRAALAAEAGSRAYFSLVNVEYSLPEQGDDISITIEMYNHGTTPAYEYQARWKYEHGLPDRTFEVISDHNFHTANTDNIGPNASVRIVRRGVPIGREAITAIRAGREKLYLHGRIEFYDSRGKHHRIDFGRQSKTPVDESKRREGDVDLYYTSRWQWSETPPPFRKRLIQ